MLLRLKQGIEIKIARVEQQVHVWQNPQNFGANLAHLALCDDLDNKEREWDIAWREELERRDLSSDTYLEGVWDRIEKGNNK